MSESPNTGPGIDEGIRETLYQLSQRHYSHGLYEPCTSVLAFLLRHDTLNPRLHFALGKALHAQSLHAGAVTSYQRALKLGLAEIDVHLYLGQCLIQLDRFAQASAALQHFVGLAAVQAASDRLTQKVDRARHLLDRIVLPRVGLAAAVAAVVPQASPRTAAAGPGAAAAAAGAGAGAGAGAEQRRHEPLETDR